MTAPTGANLTWQWKVNGSTISGATSNSYTASTSGNYQVQITNTGTGCTDTSATIPVTVGPAPSSAITPAGNVAVCQGSTLKLTTNIAPGLAYQWYLNGTAISGATDSTYQAGTAGNYTVNVSAGVGCASTTTTAVSLTVNPLPSASATAAGNTTFCQGSSVTLNANTGSNLTYQWQLNGANVPTSGTSATYAATTNGTYTVKVTDANLCTQTSPGIPVTVNSLPTATAAAAGPTTFCQNGAVTLNANTGTGLSYQWQLGGSNVATGGNAASYAATSSGTYTVKVTNTNNCVNTSNPINVTVNPLPQTTVSNPSGATYNLCTGSSVTLTGPQVSGYAYQWFLNGSPIGGATGPNQIVAAGGVYRLKTTVVTTGCTDTSATKTITVVPLPVVSTTPTGGSTICDNDTVLLSAVAPTATQWQWTRDTVSIPGAINVSYGATQFGGAYAVRVRDANNCVNTSAPYNLVVNPSPAAFVTYSSPLVFCQGGAVVLNAQTSGGAKIQWRLNGGLIPNDTLFYKTVANAGIYSIKATAANGCSRISNDVPVIVNQPPVPVVTTQDFTMTVANGPFVSYQWYRNNAQIPGATTSSYTATANGGYSVKVVDANGCEGISRSEVIGTMSVGGLAQGGVRIFPNPTPAKVNIEAPVVVNAYVRDAAGRTVLTVKEATEVDLSQLADGIYMLMITDTKGAALTTERVTKMSR
jgi:hypothetical protein